MPQWFLFSILTVVVWGLWGLQSKVAVDRLSPWINQVIFPLGLLPIVGWALWGHDRRRVAGSARIGAAQGLITGLFGGAGNVAFFLALSKGGKASVVTPLVGLAPLVTVVLALAFLGERLNKSQMSGLVFALAAIYLLSV
jgi:uncharacterized membrane protein